MKWSIWVKQTLVICIGLFLAKGAVAETLQNAILTSLHTNPNVLAAEKDSCAITQAVRGAKGGYLPTLDANAGYGVQHTESPFVLQDTPSANSLGDTTLTRRELGLTADQMLFDGFATSSEVKRNEARLNSADYKVLGTAQDIALNTAQMYLGVLREQQLVHAAQNNLSTHQHIESLLQKRTESGLDQSADLTQAQGRSSLAKSNLTAAQANLTDEKSNYLQVAGEYPSNLSQPSLQRLAQFMPKSESQAVQMAIANHPILKSAKADMDAAFAQHEASISKNYPRFDLQLSANRNDNIDGVEGQNNNELAIVRMNYNLYHGGADKARQNETAYLYQESAEIMHKTYRQVVNNAQLSWNAWQSAQKQLPLLKTHRDDALKSFNAYQNQFKLGKRSLLDMLDAQNEYFQANQAYIDSQYTATYSAFRVLNSVGSLIQAEHINFHTQSS